MIEPTAQAAIEGARVYEAFFVPALFREWARVVADAARIGAGQRVLDVACGTGALARELVSRVGPGGRVAGIDASPGMLAVAEPLAPTVEFRQGVAESLPYPDASFDRVVSQFGLMFFTDRARALGEMIRVLVPGGRLAVAVWDSVENIPAFAAEVEILERLAGRAAADALRAPFVLGDREELAALFRGADIPSAEVTTHRGTARFPSIRSLVEADVRGWLPLLDIHLDEERIAAILEEAERVMGGYASSDGRFAFPLSAHVVTAGKPTP